MHVAHLIHFNGGAKIFFFKKTSLYSIFWIKDQKLQPQKPWQRRKICIDDVCAALHILLVFVDNLCRFSHFNSFCALCDVCVCVCVCVFVCVCVCVWYNIEWPDARDGGWLRIPANHKVSKTHRMVAWLGRGEAARYIAREMHHNSDSWRTSTAVWSIDCDDWHWHRCRSSWQW